MGLCKPREHVKFGQRYSSELAVVLRWSIPSVLVATCSVSNSTRLCLFECVYILKQQVATPGRKYTLTHNYYGRGCGSHTLYYGLDQWCSCTHGPRLFGEGLVLCLRIIIHWDYDGCQVRCMPTGWNPAYQSPCHKHVHARLQTMYTRVCLSFPKYLVH